MANDTTTKRTKRTEKTKWNPEKVEGKTPTVCTRTVKSQSPGDDPQPIEYTERKLVNYTSVEEAVKALKMKPKQAIRALTLGANKLARADAIDDVDVVQKIADRRGISVEEARKRYVG